MVPRDFFPVPAGCALQRTEPGLSFVHEPGCCPALRLHRPAGRPVVAEERVIPSRPGVAEGPSPLPAAGGRLRTRPRSCALPLDRGDLGNRDYWYRRVGQDWQHAATIAAEWEQISNRLEGEPDSSFSKRRISYPPSSSTHVEDRSLRYPRAPKLHSKTDGPHAWAMTEQDRSHPRSTKLSITRFSPAFSKSTVSLFPSTKVTFP